MRVASQIDVSRSTATKRRWTRERPTTGTSRFDVSILASCLWAKDHFGAFVWQCRDEEDAAEHQPRHLGDRVHLRMEGAQTQGLANGSLPSLRCACAANYLTQKVIPHWPGTIEDARTDTFEYPPSAK